MAFYACWAVMIVKEVGGLSAEGIGMSSRAVVVVGDGVMLHVIPQGTQGGVTVVFVSHTMEGTACGIGDAGNGIGKTNVIVVVLLVGVVAPGLS